MRTNSANNRKTFSKFAYFLYQLYIILLKYLIMPLIVFNKSGYQNVRTSPPFNIEKVGNLLIYLSEKMGNLCLTKLLKFLYIIDEYSVIKSGVPVTWLNYLVWKKGPVATDVYNDINFNDGMCFKNFVEVKENRNFNGIEIKPIKAFDDSEFSEFEIELIDELIKKYGNYNSDQLVELLHKEDSLWHIIVKEKNLEVKFRNGESNTSPYVIELTDKIKNDPYKLSLYNSVKESIEL